MKKFVLLSFFLTKYLISQNLVINPSFEDTLKIYNQFEYNKNISNCYSWYDSEGVIYHNRGSFNYKKNQKNIDSSFVGECHIAMSFEPNQDFFLRDYAIGKLKEPLKADVLYHYSYNIKPKKLRYAIYSLNLQIWFSVNDSLDPFNKPKNNLKGDIGNADCNGWVRISGVYKAKGGEKYIFLNYFDLEKTDILKTKKWRKKYPKSVNLVDMVEVSSEEHIIIENDIEVSQLIENENKFENKIRVYFEHDSFQLDIQSKKLLDKFIENHPKAKLKITGYTDDTGNYRYNQKLSKNRALEVEDYMQSKYSYIITQVEGKGIFEGDLNDSKKRFVLIEIINN